jgi:DNA-binding NarL/FixJ family response regulator
MADLSPDTHIPVHVVTIEDNPIFRAALMGFLEDAGGFEIVGVAGSRAEALDCSTPMEPDIVLLDVNLPDGSGLRLIGPLRARWPHTRIVVLTLFDVPAKERLSSESGVCAFVSKTQLADELLPAIRMALADFP